MSASAICPVIHHFIGGTYCKEMHFGAGERLASHRHKYDHMAILVSGRVRVVLDGREQEISGFCVLNVPAGQEHGMIAVTDVHWLCIHATAVADPEKIDAALVEEVG